MSYSVNERAKVACWYEWTGSVVAVQRRFRTVYGHKPPQAKNIHKWHTALMATGTVQDQPRNRVLSICTAENVQRVVDMFAYHPHTSTRSSASSLNISRTSIQRILKDLHYHLYKIHTVQTLLPDCLLYTSPSPRD